MCSENVLNLLGIDVDAPRDNEPLLSAMEVKVAFFIVVCQIARVQPTIPNRLARCFWGAIVAGHHAGAAKNKFSYAVSGTDGPPMPHDVCFHSRKRLTDGRQSLQIIVRTQRCDARRGFRKSISMQN